MIGNRVMVRLTDPLNPFVHGELRKQNAEGVWLYYGWAEKAALHFFPMHTVIEIIDEGPVYR